MEKLESLNKEKTDSLNSWVQGIGLGNELSLVDISKNPLSKDQKKIFENVSKIAIYTMGY